MLYRLSVYANSKQVLKPPKTHHAEEDLIVIVHKIKGRHVVNT